MLRAAFASALALATLALTASAAQAAPAPPLGHSGRWITDAAGRVVILHGVNVVYKRPPYHPAAIGFGDDDAAFLQRHGLNTVRLGVIYKGEEPQPLQYDGDYIEQISRTEQVLARHDIFSLIDWHQDLYNERFQGEGWPDWATIDDGLPAEPRNGFPGNYLGMPALNRAFDHFWDNDPAAGRPLQGAYAAALRRVASAFRHKSHLVGYDLMNEPWPGSQYPSCANPAGCPAFDAGPLTAFTNRSIARIRKVEGQKLVWYEPLLTFDFGADTAIADTGDAGAGFSFHDYCLPGAFGGPTGDACQQAEDLPFQNADGRADATGDALLLSEFGATDDLATLRRIVDLADDHMVSWQEWQYSGRGDVTTQADKAAEALVLNPAKPPTGQNVKLNKLRALSRPYPQTIAGRPQSFSYNRQNRTFELTYRRGGVDGGPIPRWLRTEVLIPPLHYPRGYDVYLSGGRVVSRDDARILRIVRDRGAKRVDLIVRNAGAGPPPAP